MGSMKYHVWWFWHRFRPRALWVKATTVTIPVETVYGADRQTVFGTFIRLRRWDRKPPTYIASANVRGPGDTEWHPVSGNVAYQRNARGRLDKIIVTFDLPWKASNDAPFYVDTPYLGND